MTNDDPHEDDTPMTDLETATMRELVDEIEKRHEAVVVLGFRTVGKDRSDRVWMSWDGSLTLCEGLLDGMKRELAYVDRPDRRRR